MTNNVNYTVSIDASWLTFKGQDGVDISVENGVSTLKTIDVIPTKLKLLVEENNGDERCAHITFTQDGGYTKTVTINQTKNKGGIFTDGYPYFDKSKSSLIISLVNGNSEFASSGGEAFFSATYTEVYSINKYETNADGIVLNRWSEVDSTTTSNITSNAKWSVVPNDINDAAISIADGKAKLSVGENVSNGTPLFVVSATYNGLSSNAISIRQEGVAVDWNYYVRTNNSGATVCFLENGQKVGEDEVTRDVDGYYAYFQTFAQEEPSISAYLVKHDEYLNPNVKLYEADKEFEYPKNWTWEASHNGESINIDAVYAVTKKSYTVENDKSNPLPIKSEETFDIKSTLASNEEIKKKANNFASKSQWISVEEKNRYTFTITASQTTENRLDGYVDFKYIDKDSILPQAEIKLNVTQKL